jgi:pimeloyl-ACP methyl ester carboxylesterase
VVAAAAQPRWARTLLLLDPVIAVDHEEADELVADILGDLNDLDPAELLRRHPRWHVEDAAQKVLAARVVSPFVVERTIRANTTGGSSRRWQLEPTLAELAPRVHVLAADPACAAIFSPEQGAALTEAKADATVQTVVGAGHSVHRDDPAAVVAAVLALVRP